MDVSLNFKEIPHNLGLRRTELVKRHLENVCQGSKASSRYIFKMHKRQRFCKSKPCLTKTLFRDLKKTSQGHLRSVSKTLLRQLTKTSLRYL